MLMTLKRLADAALLSYDAAYDAYPTVEYEDVVEAVTRDVQCVNREGRETLESLLLDVLAAQDECLFHANGERCRCPGTPFSRAMKHVDPDHDWRFHPCDLEGLIFPDSSIQPPLFLGTNR